MPYYEQYLDYDEQYEDYCRHCEEENSSYLWCTYMNVDNSYDPMHYDDMRPYSSSSWFVDTHVKPKEPFGYLFTYRALREDIQNNIYFSEYYIEEI